MKQLIDKATVIAEIDALQDATMENGHFLSSYHEGIFDGLSKIENFLDTLEVKEMNSADSFIEKACKWLKENAYFYVNGYTGSLNDDMLVNEFHKAMEE